MNDIINIERKFNKKLTNSKIVLFFGAGFSNILDYPTMSKFVEKYLISDLNDEEKKIINFINIIKNTYDLEEILGDLEKIADVKYTFNIEEYYSIKQKIDANLELPSYKYSHKGSTPESLLKDKEGKLVSNCRNLISKIKKKIFEIYKPKKGLDYEDKYDIIFDTITNLGKFSNKKILIPIFTTNYDNVIEEYFKEKNKSNIKIHNGFDNNRTFNSNLLEDTYYNKQINIFIFHLHGSIYFYKDKEFNLIKNLELSEYLEDEHYENKIIYPTKDKTPKEEPFFTYYDYLSRCLDNSEYTIFMGYSFRDYESLIRIKSSLIYNKKLKIIIIDDKANRLKEDIFDNSKRVISLNYYFGSNYFKEQVPKKLKEIIK